MCPSRLYLRRLDALALSASRRRLVDHQNIQERSDHLVAGGFDLRHRSTFEREPGGNTDSPHDGDYGPAPNASANRAASSMSFVSRSGKSSRMFPTVMPPRSIATTITTGMRISRIHGTPRICPKRMVMRWRPWTITRGNCSAVLRSAAPQRIKPVKFQRGALPPGCALRSSGGRHYRGLNPICRFGGGSTDPTGSKITARRGTRRRSSTNSEMFWKSTSMLRGMVREDSVASERLSKAPQRISSNVDNMSEIAHIRFALPAGLISAAFYAAAPLKRTESLRRHQTAPESTGSAIFPFWLDRIREGT